MSSHSCLALCGLSGLLLSLCFPPAGLWPLAWVALVPWIVALRLGPAFVAAAASWFGGAVFFGALLYWLNLFGASAWALATVVEGLTLMVWGVLARWTGKLGPALRPVGAAALWTAVEWLRGLGQFGFSWGWLGYSQSPAIPLLPVARAGGTVGLSCLIVLVNAALAEMVVGLLRGERPSRALGRTAAVGAATALVIMGAQQWAARLPGLSGPVVRVAIIQGSVHGPLRPSEVNVPLTRDEQEESLDVYGTLTAEAAARRPALVIWPESVIPGAPEDEPWIAGRVSDVARMSDAWLLAGGPYTDERGRPYNSAYLYSPTGNLVSRYDKVHLVPFGEYVPGRSWLPFLDRYEVRAVDFAAGPVHRVLQAGTMALGPMICFESTFPTIAWSLAQRGAQVLVVITNDAWFGRTAAAAQHRQVAVLRAAETGLWVLRGASTGISSIIGPDGRIAAEAELFERKELVHDVRLTRAGRRSPGSGPLFAWAMVGLAIAYIIAPLALPRGRRRDRGARPRAAPQRRGRGAPR